VIQPTVGHFKVEQSAAGDGTSMRRDSGTSRTRIPEPDPKVFGRGYRCSDWRLRTGYSLPGFSPATSATRARRSSD